MNPPAGTASSCTTQGHVHRRAIEWTTLRFLRLVNLTDSVFDISSAQTPRKRHRSGCGPPAAAVITWALLSDPALRSAWEYSIARGQTAQHRVRGLRRRLCVRCLMSIMLLAVTIRIILMV